MSIEKYFKINGKGVIPLLVFGYVNAQALLGYSYMEITEHYSEMRCKISDCMQEEDNKILDMIDMAYQIKDIGNL